MLKGSGYSTGKTLNINGSTKAQIEKSKTNNVYKAHELVMKYIIIWVKIGFLYSSYILTKIMCLKFELHNTCFLVCIF